MHNGAATIRESMAVLKKLETELSYDPAILFVGIYTKESKSGS
jgi:hypothetical protein